MMQHPSASSSLSNIISACTRLEGCHSAIQREQNATKSVTWLVPCRKQIYEIPISRCNLSFHYRFLTGLCFLSVNNYQYNYRYQVDNDAPQLHHLNGQDPDPGFLYHLNGHDPDPGFLPAALAALYASTSSASAGRKSFLVPLSQDSAFALV